MLLCVRDGHCCSGLLPLLSETPERESEESELGGTRREKESSESTYAAVSHEHRGAPQPQETVLFNTS